MSSASPAEGGLISKTPRRTAWLEWRPADLSVKAVSERVKTQLLIHIPRTAGGYSAQNRFPVGQRHKSWIWMFDEEVGKEKNPHFKTDLYWCEHNSFKPDYECDKRECL